MGTLKLAYYGDDFTGSTDALEFLYRCGIATVLFIEPPTIAQLQQFPDIAAYGVAGKTRSLSPAAMEAVLKPAFEQMKATGARHIHYKVCSTFDSSPVTGSIGKAMDCGAEVFDTTCIPVLGGMPALGRYCVFGNLFAKMGIGSSGSIYRLDRHPSMSKHPVTPADESDLRKHLARQTLKEMALIDVVTLDKPVHTWSREISGEAAVLIDALTHEQLTTIGEWLETQQQQYPLFSVGPSGIELALGNYWNKVGAATAISHFEHPGAVDALLVVSGSCSPVTQSQIRYAKTHGFTEVVIDAKAINDGGMVDAAAIEQVNDLLKCGKHVIVHTGTKNTQTLSSEKLGTALGLIGKQAVVETGIKRVVVAGGDTSSYAARAMEINAVAMLAPLVIGAPLCTAYSDNAAIQGLQVNFKGGQVGADNYFEVLVQGALP
jgi:uncharacterized protein YgbK (DUF1537 family)